MRETGHMVEMGVRMRQAIDEAGLSPEEVATRLGTSAPTVYRWLTGQSRTTAERMNGFAAVVGRSRLWLEFGPEAADYLADGFRRWADAVAAGLNPGKALKSPVGLSGRLDSKLLGQVIENAPRFIENLEALAGAPWATLDAKQKEEAARKLVQTLENLRPFLP